MFLCDSKPNSWYRFSWEVPLVAPVMARDALCCVELIISYYWKIHFMADHKSHHHSRNGALQKNGREARKNDIEFTNNYNTIISFIYLFINMMFECKLFIKMYP